MSIDHKHSDLEWGDETKKTITHIKDSKDFEKTIKSDQLSVVRVGVWDNIQVSDITAWFLEQYWDKINFFTIDFHSVSQTLPEYHEPWALAKVKPPFTVIYWEGKRLGPIIFGTISDNNQRIHHILQING